MQELTLSIIAKYKLDINIIKQNNSRIDAVFIRITIFHKIQPIFHALLNILYITRVTTHYKWSSSHSSMSQKKTLCFKFNVQVSAVTRRGLHLSSRPTRLRYWIFRSRGFISFWWSSTSASAILYIHNGNLFSVKQSWNYIWLVHGCETFLFHSHIPLFDCLDLIL